MMEKTILNEAGHWETWPKHLLEALDKATSNEQVGERLVFENEDFKVWSIHLLPGKRLPFHKHCKPYFWTVLTNGESISRYHNGAIVKTVYHNGDTANFDTLSDENYFIHDLENIGETTLIFSTVEFKKPIH